MTSPRALISVVIPVFNSEQWLGAAIESVLAQDASEFEVVVVDDGSTDRTPEIIKEYGDKVLAIHQSNQGVVEARRNGVAQASGRFIKFLDADDLLPEGALRQFGSAAINHPGEVLVGRSREFAECGRDLGGRMYSIGYCPEDLALIRKEFLLTQATSSSLWLIPREVFNEHDLLQPSGINMGEEFGFCMRLIASGIPIRYLDIDVSLVRVHDSPGRLSRSKDESRHLIQIGQIEQAVEFIRERIPGYSPEALEKLARLCWSRGRNCLRIECVQAAGRYFKLAREIDPAVVPVGGGIYRTLAALVGPRASEWVLEVSKKAIAARSGT